jgi:phosphonate transport system substrate-binding protein
MDAMNIRTGRLLFCFGALFLALYISTALAAEDVSEALEKEAVEIDFDDVVPEDMAPSTVSERPVIRIAVAAMISPKETYRYYVDLLNLIARRLDRDVVFVQKKTYREVNVMLKQNELDLAFVCSGPYASGKDEFGMEIIAVPVCHGETVYYSYFIASSGSGIQSFEDFRGKTFVFTDPLSNTGYMVPTYYLARRGESAESFFGKTYFTNSHDNSIQAVAGGIADGAAVDSLVYDFMSARKPELTAKTVVVEKSPPYGIPPVVVPPSLSPEIKSALTNIFLTIHEAPEGKAILDEIQVERFVAGKDRDYDTVRELQRYVNAGQP